MQVLGIVKAFWLGNEVELQGNDSTFSLGGLVGQAKRVGVKIARSMEMQESTVKLNFAVKAGMSVTGTFPQGVEGELQVECDTGQTFTWPDAFVMGTVDFGSSNGGQVTLVGGTPSETLAS
jgi:hypothetical protein